MENEGKEELLQNLNEAFEYAKNVDQVLSRLAAIDTNIAATQKKKGNPLVTIITIVLCVIAYCPGGFICMYLARLLNIYKYRDGDAIVIGFVAMTVLCIAAIILAIIIDIAKNIKKKNFKKNRLAGLYDERKSNEQKLQHLVNTNRNVLNTVPKEYLYPMALEYFINVLKIGRADTMKEAMNLYEDQVHKWKMESFAQASLVAQQEANAIAAFNATANLVSAAANVGTAINTF